MAALYNDSRLPAELDEQVRAELRDDERLLWVGQPGLRHATLQAAPIVMFGVVWTAFSLFWVALTAGLLQDFGRGQFGGGGAGLVGLVFPLFGVPFVLMGFGMLSAPFWMRRNARRSAYVLTDRRAILRQPGWFGAVEVRSFDAAELKKLRRVERGSGTGDLVFKEIVRVSRNSDGHRTTSTTRYGFFGIEDVRGIEELIRRGVVEPNTAV